MNNPHLSRLTHAERFAVITEMARIVVPVPAGTLNREMQQQLADSTLLAAAVAHLFFPDLLIVYASRMLDDTIEILQSYTHLFSTAAEIEDCIIGTAALYREGDTQWKARINACAYFLRDWRLGLDEWLRSLPVGKTHGSLMGRYLKTGMAA